jgi:hypothetical protein
MHCLQSALVPPVVCTQHGGNHCCVVLVGFLAHLPTRQWDPGGQGLAFISASPCQ